jgi:hypothetical protein
VGEQIVADGLAPGVQLIDGAAELDGVPEDHGGDSEIEVGRPVSLIFESVVADFAETMKEDPPGERVARLAFVEAGVGPPPQGWIADPVEGEQRALETADLPERLRQRILFGIMPRWPAGLLGGGQGVRSDPESEGFEEKYRAVIDWGNPDEQIGQVRKSR